MNFSSTNLSNSPCGDKLLSCTRPSESSFRHLLPFVPRVNSFVSLELGLNLFMCLRDCTGRGCVGVKPILTTLCHRLCNISQTSVNLPFSRLQSQFTQQSPMEDVSHLWSLFCFDSFPVLTYLPSPFWQDQTCTCVQDVGKTWTQTGTTTASLLFSAPFPKQS